MHLYKHALLGSEKYCSTPLIRFDKDICYAIDICVQVRVSQAIKHFATDKFYGIFSATFSTLVCPHAHPLSDSNRQ